MPTIATPDDSLLMLLAAWQRLREQYVRLVAVHKAGQHVDPTVLAQSFIDMNNALEATMAAAQRAAAPHESRSE